MSEQPPSVAPRTASTTHTPGMLRLISAPDLSARDFVASDVSVRDVSVLYISVLDLDDIGPLLAHIQHVTDELLLVTDCKPHLGRRDLVLAHEEEVDVVRGQGVVERRPDQIARPRRPHEARRHDDGEIGLVLLIGLAR